MIDTHCHLNDAKYENVDEIVNNFLRMGVDKAICIGWDYLSSVRAIELSNQYDSVYAVVGVHPDECDSFNKQELEAILRNKSKKILAVGEIGLDYFHNKDNKDKQIKVFEQQIALAYKYNLPIVIHTRDAFSDTLNIVKKYAPFKFGAVVHCYSGSLEFARELIKLGVKLSFTGSVTYKNATNLQNVAKNIPLDSFFFETDSPYLTPVPHRGEQNEPKNVKHIIDFVAELRGMDSILLEKITDENAKKFFRLN